MGLSDIELKEHNLYLVPDLIERYEKYRPTSVRSLVNFIKKTDVYKQLEEKDKEEIIRDIKRQIRLENKIEIISNFNDFIR